VVATTAPVAPADPTARQSSLSGHETAASTLTEVGTTWALQVVPPFVVASIAAALPFPNPTAQQCRTSPHETPVALYMDGGAG
jgi:hypothetical protein